MLIEKIETLLKQVRKKTQAIRFVLKQNQSLRNVLFTNDEEVRKKAAELKLDLLENPISRAEWDIYQNSAVLTQLYATYENFVEELIRKWLEALPQLVTKYDQLDEVIRHHHSIGVSKLIPKLIPKLEDDIIPKLKKYDRYAHLNLEKIIKGLFYGINKNSQYELIPDCFLISFQNNLRQTELQNLLNAVGLNLNNKNDFVWKWLENHQNIKEYIDNILGGSNTLKNELDQFVENRNVISHSLVQEDNNNILGYDLLLNLCFFVEAICEALADLLIFHFLIKKANINKAKQIGTIQNFLSNKKVIIATVKNVTLSVGDKIFIVNQNSSYCKAAIIIGLCNKKEESKQIIRVRKEQEISLQIDMTTIKYAKPKRNHVIYILKV